MWGGIAEKNINKISGKVNEDICQVLPNLTHMIDHYTYTLDDRKIYDESEYIGTDILRVAKGGVQRINFKDNWNNISLSKYFDALVVLNEKPTDLYVKALFPFTAELTSDLVIDTAFLLGKANLPRLPDSIGLKLPLLKNYGLIYGAPSRYESIYPIGYMRGYDFISFVYLIKYQTVIDRCWSVVSITFGNDGRALCSKEIASIFIIDNQIDKIRTCRLQRTRILTLFSESVIFESGTFVLNDMGCFVKR